VRELGFGGAWRGEGRFSLFAVLSFAVGSDGGALLN